MGGSWKTGLAGYIMIAAGIMGLIAEAVAKQGIPDTIMEWFTFGSLIAGGIIGILAKDSDVSNAPHPAAATVVSTVDAGKSNPSATVVKSIGLMFLIVFAGTALTACASMESFFGDSKNQLENIIAVNAAGTYHVSGTVKKDGNVLLTYSQIWECTQADGKLTGCHKRNPAPAAVVP